MIKEFFRIVKELFKKKYLIPAVWSLLVAIIGFVLGHHGRETAMIPGGKGVHDTVVVQFVDRPVPPVRNLDAYLDSLRSEFKKLQHLVAKSVASPGKPLEHALPLRPNRLQPSPFQLPSIAVGYLSKSLDAFAVSDCPPPNVNYGDILELKFSLLGTIDRKELTPAFVFVYGKGPEGQLVGQLYEQQYELREGDNRIVIVAGLSEGSYEIVYGFYRISELNTKYPPFYSQRCDFSVVSKKPLPVIPIEPTRSPLRRLVISISWEVEDFSVSVDNELKSTTARECTVYVSEGKHTVLVEYEDKLKYKYVYSREIKVPPDTNLFIRRSDFRLQ
jgi:hypothetical protein